MSVELISHASVSDENVLFLTPNHDQDQDVDECPQNTEDQKTPQGVNLGQISILADTDDLNETDNISDNNIQQNHIYDSDSIKKEVVSMENQDEQTKLNMDDSVLSEMKYLFKNTRYFLIKSNNFENVALAQKKGVWSTPRVNEIKLNKAYRECANVLLIFSVAESGRFQGYARLSSECSRDDDLQVDWILPPNLSARSLKGVFKIDWITKNDLFFTKCAYILNPWNENKPVKVGRDGQEMEPRAGEILCRQFEFESSNSQNGLNLIGSETMANHINSIIVKSKKRHEELVKERERQKSRYSDRDRRDRKSKSRERNSKSPGGSPRSDEREHRDSEKPITAPYNNNSYQQNSNYYQRNQRDYQSSSSHKRNHYDVNNKPHRSHYEQQQFQLNRQNYNPQNFNQQIAFNQQQNLQQQQGGFNPYNQQQGQQQNMYVMNQQQQAYYNQGMYGGQQGGMPQTSVNNPYQMQHGQPTQHAFNTSTTTTTGNRYSAQSDKSRNRSSSPNKKQRVSSDFLPVAKEIVLKSTTYEEYLAAASSIIPAQSSQTTKDGKSVFDRIRQPVDVTQFVNYDALSYQSSNPSSYTLPTIQASSSSKYEQDVEEFLRRTAVTSQPVTHSKYREEGIKLEKKSSSRDKDGHRHHRHRHGSSGSQERSTKRRSRERR